MAEVSIEAPIVEEVGTQKFSVEDVVIEDYISSGEDGKDAEQGNGHDDESAPTDGQFFYDNEGIDTAYETEYDVQSSKDDNDDVNEDFLVNEENEIVEPDVDVHLFGEDVDVINADGFDSNPGNDEERNYRKRSPKEAKDRVYLHFIESRRNLKLYKNDSARIRARCKEKVLVFIISQGTGPTGPYSGIEAGPSGSNGPTTKKRIKMVKKHRDTHTCLQSRKIKHYTYKLLSEKIFKQVKVNPNILVKAVQDQLQRELEVQISMSKAFRAKAKAKREIRGDHVLQYSMLTIYYLGHIHENIKHGWCGQAYKDLLWRAASAINVRDFKKRMLELKTMNPKAHEWLDKIPAEHWARSYFSESNLIYCSTTSVRTLMVVGDRDKPVITLLEYIREYCMKIIMNAQGLIDKCVGLLTLTTTGIMESIKKEAYLMKVGRPKKKRKRSKHEDELFVKDGKLSRKGRTITCQSCRNIKQNKATCKGQGGNTAESSGSASRKAQQTELAVGQDGSGGSGNDAIIGFSAAAREGGAGDPGGAGVSSQGSSHTRWTRKRVQTERISPKKELPLNMQVNLLLVLKCQ
nr:hypothetical protein [Tanacetum cinerariifolium]